MVICLFFLVVVIFHAYRKKISSIVLAGIVASFTRLVYRLRIYLSAAEKDLDQNASDLIVFSYLTIKLATDKFSKNNKLGEGGFGSVYKVTFRKSCVNEMLHAKRNYELKAKNTACNLYDKEPRIVICVLGQNSFSCIMSGTLYNIQ